MALISGDFKIVTRAILAWFLLSMASQSMAGELGLNKFDLLQQYLGFASGGDGTPPFVTVTTAMARKAIGDASQTNASFVRISLTGYRPIDQNDGVNDVLNVWLSQPKLFWQAVDMMFSDLEQKHIRAIANLNWNKVQFPSLSKETVHDLMSAPASASRTMAKRFATEAARHLKAKHNLLFYEVGNEFNLDADLDLKNRCIKSQPNKLHACENIGNFSSSDLLGYGRDIVDTLRVEDPKHLVSPGYGAPRTSAAHLARQPEWSAKGADWQVDSQEENLNYFSRLSDPFQVVSAHVYPPDLKQSVDISIDIVKLLAGQAHKQGKYFFLGEFGENSAELHFDSKVISLVGAGLIDFAAIWVWEFYQSNTFRSASSETSKYNIEPGYRDDLIAALSPGSRRINGAPSDSLIIVWPLPCSSRNNVGFVSVVASHSLRVPKLVNYFLGDRFWVRRCCAVQSKPQWN